MAGDAEAGLPVRTKEDLDERLQTKIVDGTTVANVLEIDTDSNLHAELHGNVEGTGADATLLTDAGGCLKSAMQGLDASGPTRRDVAVDGSGRLRTVVEDSTSGTPVYEEDNTVDLAKNGTHTTSYTPAANKILKARSVYVSARDQVKIEVKWGTTASEVLKITYFTSAAKPGETITLTPEVDIDETMTILVDVTNLGNKSQNVYATISGSLIDA